MSAEPPFELGTLVGGTWKQCATSAGQDCYMNLSTRALQYAIPTGWEDAATDTCDPDMSKNWPQWRNTRTGRIRLLNPNPPTPRDYLESVNVQIHLRLLERVPESHEYMYRRVMTSILNFFFPADQGFEILHEESRGAVGQRDSIADMAVLKVVAFPAGSTYIYDYCLVESKSSVKSWDEATQHLTRHCAGTDNESKKVYGVAQVGLFIQFFTAASGQLSAFSDRLHIRDDVGTITAKFEEMKRVPIAFND